MDESVGLKNLLVIKRRGEESVYVIDTRGSDDACLARRP
jgi:hypothetical protein